MAKTPNPLTFLLAAIGLAVLILGYGWSHWWWIAVAVCAFATYMCFKKQPIVGMSIFENGIAFFEGETPKASRTELAVLAANDPNDYETWSTNAAKMSEIQFEDWAAQFIDAEFTFTGLVKRVDELVFEEGFEAIVDFDVDFDDGFETARLLMNRDHALTVPANSQITFTGTLIEVNTLFGLRLTFVNVTFTEG